MRPDAFDVDLQRCDRKPEHPLELVHDAGPHRLCDLGELQSVLDHDAELDDEAVGTQVDVGPFLIPQGNRREIRPRPASAAMP